MNSIRWHCNHFLCCGIENIKMAIIKCWTFINQCYYIMWVVKWLQILIISRRVQSGFVERCQNPIKKEKTDIVVHCDVIVELSVCRKEIVQFSSCAELSLFCASVSVQRTNKTGEKKEKQYLMSPFIPVFWF